MNLMGVDIGTTGCKACTFSEKGDLLYCAYREYLEYSRSPGIEEVNPEYVFEMVCACIKENNEKLKGNTAAGLALSVSGDECIMMDEEGKTLSPVIMSRDSRGEKETKKMARRISEEALFSMTGLPLHRKYGIFRLMWYQAHCPDLFHKAAHVMTWEDFMLYRMGDRSRKCSLSSAARLMMINIETNRYERKILEAAQIPEKWLPLLVPSGNLTGSMDRKLAEKLLFDYTPVLATGGFDQSCAAAGAGLSEECAVVGSGTMESLSFSGRDGQMDMGCHYPLNYHLIPGYFISTATNVGGGAILKWYRDHLEDEQNRDKGYDYILRQCGKSPSGLLLLPHFAGAGPPSKDADSMGAILGLQISTEKRQILQAILEGITFELRQNLELLETGCGKKINKLRVVGGGSKSDYWLRLKADITGKIVVRMENKEAGCAAGAMAAAMAMGQYKNWEEASALFAREGKEFLPDCRRGKKYEPYYQLYQKLYPSLAEFFHEMKRLL